MKMKLNSIFTCILCAGLMNSVQSGDLKAPFALPSAKVLPKGVRNFSYKGISTSPSQKYDNNGQKTVLADPFFTDLTYQNIIDGKKSISEKAGITSAMLSAGASENDSFGTTTGQINLEANVHVPVFAMGLTKKWTVALAVPVLKASLNVNAGVIQKNSALHTAFIKALNDKGVSSKSVEFGEKIATPIQTKFREYGYEQLANQNVTKLGDIKLVSKYQLMNNNLNRVVLSTELTLPTGEDQSIYKAVDIASGDNQTDIGLGLNYDYLLSKNLTLLIGSTYTIQLKDKNPERIPEKSSSKLSPDIDWEASRNLGDIWSTQIGGLFSYEGVNLGAAYGFQFKSEDSYSGKAYSQERYDWLEQETEQVMHSLQASIGYDTISLFKQKRFPVPLSISLSHTRVIAGKNVINNPLTSLDMSLFF